VVRCIDLLTYTELHRHYCTQRGTARDFVSGGSRANLNNTYRVLAYLGLLGGLTALRWRDPYCTFILQKQPQVVPRGEEPDSPGLSIN